MKLFCENHEKLPEAFLPNSSTKECFSTHGLDEFTLLHFISGLIGKKVFPNKKIYLPLSMHLLWEYLETTEVGKKIFSDNLIINGSRIKYEGDSYMNSTVDNIAFTLGYYLQKKIDLSKKDLTLIYIISYLLVYRSSNKRFTPLVMKKN